MYKVYVGHNYYTLPYIFNIYLTQVFLTYFIEFSCIGVELSNLYTKNNNFNQYIRLNYYSLSITYNINILIA